MSETNGNGGKPRRAKLYRSNGAVADRPIESEVFDEPEKVPDGIHLDIESFDLDNFDETSKFWIILSLALQWKLKDYVTLFFVVSAFATTWMPGPNAVLDRLVLQLGILPQINTIGEAPGNARISPPQVPRTPEVPEAPGAPEARSSPSPGSTPAPAPAPAPPKPEAVPGAPRSSAPPSVGSEFPGFAGEFAAQVVQGTRILNHTVTSGGDFGPRSAPTAGASSFHRGIDYPAPTGTPLFAFVPEGQTIEVDCAEDRGGGTIAYIRSSYYPGKIFVAMHLSVCEEGRYKAGQVFAKIGNTGVSTGPHLHWEEHTLLGGKETQQIQESSARYKDARGNTWERRPATLGFMLWLLTGSSPKQAGAAFYYAASDQLTPPQSSIPRGQIPLEVMGERLNSQGMLLHSEAGSYDEVLWRLSLGEMGVHAVIRRTGEIVYLVPLDTEAVPGVLDSKSARHPTNRLYHIYVEPNPQVGEYTQEQYLALAWMMRRLRVSAAQIDLGTASARFNVPYLFLKLSEAN